MVIAHMRQIAFDTAISESAEMCWSLDSDVLPPPNALRCSIDMLGFDDGFYSIAQCPYPSQGGGPFLGGHGTPQRPIEEDFDVHERKVPSELLEEKERLEGVLGDQSAEEDKGKARERLQEIHEEIKKCEPEDEGNIWKLNAKGWRRRGWFDRAYPAIGQGAIVPIEWVGFFMCPHESRSPNTSRFHWLRWPRH